MLAGSAVSSESLDPFSTAVSGEIQMYSLIAKTQLV
jgi:hypothetical protein